MKKIINSLHGMGVPCLAIHNLYALLYRHHPDIGGLADIFGRKPIFMIGAFTFLMGSVFCGMSHSMTALILFRGVQGLGSGILTTGVFTIVADLFPPQLRGKYMGIVTSVFGLSSIIGPLIGGLITDYLSWRWIFYINLPIGIAAVILILLFMPNFKAKEESNRVDYSGTIFIVLSLVPLLLGFSFAGSTFAWGSVQIIGLFAFSAVCSYFSSWRSYVPSIRLYRCPSLRRAVSG